MYGETLVTGRGSTSRQARVDIANFLSEWSCPECSNRGRWTFERRPIRRYQSIVSIVRCDSCGLRVFVKRHAVKSGSEELNRENAKSEYCALCTVFREFPQDDEFGTPEPLLLDTYRSVLAIRFIDGVPVSHYLMHRREPHAWRKREEYVTRASRWLRRFHGACQLDQVALDADEKYEVIREKWTGVRQPRSVREALTSLRETRVGLDEMPLARSWVHGDFTPDNVMLERERTIGIDIGLRANNAVTYDIGSFLNHIRLMSHPVCMKSNYPKHCVLEEAFLADYGYTGEHERRALSWIRLYFMLSYWKAYLERSPAHRANVTRRLQFSYSVECLKRELMQWFS